MKNLCILLLIFAFPFVFFSCNDIISLAENKVDESEKYSYDYPVTSFIIEQGNDNRELIISWTNPSDVQFAGTKLFRKTGSIPEGTDDSDAVLLYSGSNERYTDSGLTPNITYYYAAFAEDTNKQYSKGNYSYYTVTETTQDIRERSFFLIGGSSSKTDPTGNLVSGIDMFDPMTESITADVATLPVPRVFCDIASVNGKIYVFGGMDGSGVVDTVDILDISDLSWSTGTVMPSPKSGLGVVTWYDKIFCIAGSTTTVAGGGSTDVHIYDPVQDSWTQDSDQYNPIGTARTTPTTVVWNGAVYYYGGVNTSGAYLANGEVHDIASNQDIALAGLLSYIGATSALYHKSLDNGDNIAIYFTIGGSSDNTEPALPAATINLSTNYVYAAFLPNINGGDPAGNRVYPQGGPNTGIEAFTNRIYAGCESYGDYVYYFGGITADSLPSTIIERMDVKDGILTTAEWTVLLGTLSTARYGFGITKVNK